MVEPVICYPYFSDDNYSNATLYVPIGALSAYKNVDPWSNFLNIEEIDFSGVDGIEAAGDSKTEVGRYNLHGVEVGDDYKGLIVIKYSDGTCCKKYSY